MWNRIWSPWCVWFLHVLIWQLWNKISHHQFDQMPKRNVTSWSAMIVGYRMHGHGEEALVLFAQMKETDMKTISPLFVFYLLVVMQACWIRGDIFSCLWFKITNLHPEWNISMHGGPPWSFGHLNEAHEFIEKIPLHPGATMWGALLGVCRVHLW